MSEYKLTPRENLIEVMKGGKPERFVKQYEAFNIPFRDLATYRWRLVGSFFALSPPAS